MDSRRRRRWSAWVSNVEVRLFATLRDNREKVSDIPWRETITGRDVLGSLGIDPEDVSIFLVNGVRSNPDVKLKPDDIIALFPPVGGG